MKTLRARIIPLSAFGTPPKGDTLFGQVCWAARNRFCEARLTKLLDGYTQNQPFAVASDALPADHLPRPVLPGHWFEMAQNTDRKTVKKLAWMPLEYIKATPVANWLAHCQLGTAIPGGTMAEHPQPHNTLNRDTGTTGQGQFAPYTMNQLWYGQKTKDTTPSPILKLDLYWVLDEARLTADELCQLLEDIGTLGFGRDASIGLGKFRVDSFDPFDLPAQPDANAWLTLGPCAPQGLAWQSTHCFYTPFTRFGRHGDLGVHLTHGPFKAPVLLANTGAVLTPTDYQTKSFIGQGLGGNGSLSKTIPATVHQGYAPVIGIKLPTRKEMP
ncbi:CRISPR-associated protein Csm4 [Gammaproteobacteria bacterium]